jgi:hypothetical protein
VGRLPVSCRCEKRLVEVDVIGRPLTYAPAAAQQQLTIRSAPASDPHLELLKQRDWWTSMVSING